MSHRWRSTLQAWQPRGSLNNLQEKGLAEQARLLLNPEDSQESSASPRSLHLSVPIPSQPCSAPHLPRHFPSAQVTELQMPAVLWSLLPSLRELRGPWLSWKPGTKYKSLSPQALPLPSKEFLGSSGGPGRTPPPHFHLAVILILTPGAQPGEDFKA